MSARITAADRYRRILAMIPWIAEHGPVTLTEVADRFNITSKQVEADLDVILLVGVPPYYPDDYIDVTWGTDTVSIRLGDQFERPLNLTASEALAVLVSAAGVAALDADDDRPLPRAMRKLREALGVPDGTLEVALGSGDAAHLDALRQAIETAAVVRIDYYSASSDSIGTREIEPHRLFAAEGHWYVTARCRTARDNRVFRVDRIRSLELTDDTFEAPTDLAAPSVFEANESARRIVFDLEPGTRFLWSTARPDSVEERPDGTTRVVLAVGGPGWLERILIELGSGAHVVDGVIEGSVSAAEAAAVRRGAAERMLRRYQR